MKRSARAKGGGAPSDETFVVRTLAQAKLLSDPLRLRILRAFVDEPRTTKQVAGLLGENATKLYRHVRALEEAGLLALESERQNRGTVERYLRAVARRFEVDATLFDAPARPRKRASTQANVVRSLLGQAQAEILSCIEAGGDTHELAPVVARISVRAPEARIRELRDKLLEWTESCGKESGAGEGEMMEFSGVVAFYPAPGSGSGESR
jgi:DNA-binding transcriptional ArsR family regulator